MDFGLVIWLELFDMSPSFPYQNTVCVRVARESGAASSEEEPRCKTSSVIYLPYERSLL